MVAKEKDAKLQLVGALKTDTVAKQKDVKCMLRMDLICMYFSKWENWTDNLCSLHEAPFTLYIF
jgi:hypothetical protein